jgi:UDP-N-acetylmuramoyl-L-alanyl-D-glutamate--2,6-diaminopimelate ligase
MMKIANIIKGIKASVVKGNENTEVVDICFDSRQVKPGSMFVAIAGTQSDGHLFISKAIENGATSIVYQNEPEQLAENIVWLKAGDSAEALGLLCSNFYDNPSRKLKLVGVTGTNGKTTTATLLYRLFKKLGYRVGLISTVVYFVDDKSYEATHTTPGPLQLNRLMAEMVEIGCEYCFMEVSSHSIEQKRIAGLDFDGAIFSNITQDHLDFHLTFDNYIKAKKQLFDKLKPEAFALVNVDDRNGRVMVQNTKARVKTYALRSLADYKAKLIESHFEGMQISIDNTELWVNLIGEFNVYNLLAIYSAARLLGQDKEEVLKIISSLHEVSGRFETVRSNKGITAIVDYAHTPDALENVLSTIHGIRKGNEQIITVVGAGGNRDKGKRPIMAKICVEMSDKVIITSDNPRNEEPQDIINDMLVGVDKQHQSKTLVIVDRREAIKTAVMLAREGDIVLVAGKGHETYQEIKGVKHHFDDKEVLKDIM